MESIKWLVYIVITAGIAAGAFFCTLKCPKLSECPMPSITENIPASETNNK